MEQENFEISLFTTLKHINEHISKVNAMKDSITYEDYKKLTDVENILDTLSMINFKKVAV